VDRVSPLHLKHQIKRLQVWLHQMIVNPNKLVENRQVYIHIQPEHLKFLSMQ